MEKEILITKKNTLLTDLNDLVEEYSFYKSFYKSENPEKDYESFIINKEGFDTNRDWKSILNISLHKEIINNRKNRKKIISSIKSLNNLL